MTFKPPKPAKEPEPRPGVEVGDHLYVHHQGQPCSGVVRAHGKHGVTVEIDKQQHKVKWDKVLGHKKRAQQRYNVIEQGEDGMLVEDGQGKRRFVAVPNEAKEDPMVAKAFGQRPVLLFMKAAGAAPGPGLQQKKITDKNGVQTTRWVSIDMGGPPAQKGQHVGFANGEHKGHGQVVAAGQHGVTVRDRAGGEHRVHHEKITHHWQGDGAPNEGPHEENELDAAGKEYEAQQAHAKRLSSGGAQHVQLKHGDGKRTALAGPDASKPGGFRLTQFDNDAPIGHSEHPNLESAVMRGLEHGYKPHDKPQSTAPAKPEIKPHDGHPDDFNAQQFAAQHDDASVTAESIVDGFGPDAKSKIEAAGQRAGSVKQTIDQHYHDGKWNDERAKLHRKLMFEGVTINGKTVPGLLAPDRVKAATPGNGQAPTFIALGGRGGSGKSSLNGRVYEESRAIVLDADHIKGMLPEYEGWNAHQVHEESSDVLEAVLRMAKILGVNVVLDATMKTGKSIESKVDEFKSAGFRTEAHYMHLPRQEATKRAIGRFLGGGEKGRYVPPAVVLGNTKNEENFDKIKSKVDAWSFHDNSGEKGSDPKLIAQKGEPGTVAKKPLLKSEHGSIILLWKTKS